MSLHGNLMFVLSYLYFDVPFEEISSIINFLHNHGNVSPFFTKTIFMEMKISSLLKLFHFIAKNIEGPIEF